MICGTRIASTAVASGQGLPMIGKLLGHTQVQTTARYAHLAADPMKTAADQIAGTLRRRSIRPPEHLRLAPFVGRFRSAGSTVTTAPIRHRIDNARERQLGAPVGLYFLQIADRHFNGRLDPLPIIGAKVMILTRKNGRNFAADAVTGRS